MSTLKFVAPLIRLTLVMGLAACRPAASPDPALTPVTLQFSWTHQAQFAGYYAADQNGDYAEEDLTVRFLEGGPNVVAMTSVLDGAAQFGVATAHQVLLWRARGKPVKAIATIYRRSPRVYIALAESSITRPQDFVGKTISVERGGGALLNAMMSRLGIGPEQYTVVESTLDLSSFYSGEVQVHAGFLNNEVLIVRAAGHNINVIYPDDYGIHFYGDTLFTTDDLIASNPNLVLRFLRATLKGWTWAVENPAQVGPLVVGYKPEADAELEVAKMTASLPLVNTGEDFIGWMKPEIWNGIEQTLREQGVLTDTLDVKQAYTLQFLEEIYGK
jgi:NitT/TauT family transport system substrate-binding protein